MILAVDIGNTNIVVGCCDKNKIIFVERLSTKMVDTELEYAVSFKNVFELHNIDTKKIDGGIISSVVPSITNVIKRAVKKRNSKKNLKKKKKRTKMQKKMKKLKAEIKLFLCW